MTTYGPLSLSSPARPCFASPSYFVSLFECQCVYCRLEASMATTTAQRHYWIFSADPHHYHWDTLFVKGKEMWHGAGAKPDPIRALKQGPTGPTALGYPPAPDR